MPPKNFFTDIHCHPTLKPYGRSADGSHPDSPSSKASVWYYDPPTVLDKLADIALSVARYSQSDFSTLANGQAGVVCIALYPPETGFFKNRLGSGREVDKLLNFVTQFGLRRINRIQNNSFDYFSDLQKEYAYLNQQNGREVQLAGRRKYKYALVKNYGELMAALDSPGQNTLAVILTIEGGHSFGCGKDPQNAPASHSKVLANADTVKNWPFRPLFVTLAHHFYNELCGHAKSFPPPLDMALDQKYGMDTVGLTDLGKKVVLKLLDNSAGKRILVDLKHMSRPARDDYYRMLDTEYKNEKIPILYSHCGVQGNAGNRHLFNTWPINLFDDEIIRIQKSGGLIGLELDQRILASEQERKNASGNLARYEMLYKWSKLLWNNAEHIALTLNASGLSAWDNISIGSDYDGIINPINGFWTAGEFPALEAYLNMHAHNFMKNNPGVLLPQNRIGSADIVHRIMQENTMAFLKVNFK